jgi:hypothetical protein
MIILDFYLFFRIKKISEALLEKLLDLEERHSYAFTTFGGEGLNFGENKIRLCGI